MASKDSNFAKEMEALRKTQSLQDYVTLFGDKNKKMSLYLYENYYLNRYPQKVKNDCLSIAKDFSTYVFLPKDYADTDLKFIHTELSKWNRASQNMDEKAKLPKYIKFYLSL